MMLPRPPSLPRSQTIFRSSQQYSLLHPQRIRKFHASPRCNDLGEAILYVPHQILTGLHATGLSWALVIPITAIAIRCIVVPLLVIPARRERAKISELLPLISAKALHVRDLCEKDMKENPQLLANKSPQRLYKERVQADTAALMKRYGVDKRKTFSAFLQIPIFLIFTETLRRMMGMRSSILFRGGQAPPKEGDSSASLVNVVETTNPDISAVADSTSWYDPSMTLEGPFAIIDLTASDPTMILPLMVSALMFANLGYGNRQSQGIAKSKFSRRLHNSLMGFAVMLFPLTLHLPAGFLYYWACSSASSLGSNILVDWLYPPRPVVRPCRRRLPSMPAKKEKKAVIAY